MPCILLFLVARWTDIIHIHRFLIFNKSANQSFSTITAIKKSRKNRLPLVNPYLGASEHSQNLFRNNRFIFIFANSPLILANNIFFSHLITDSFRFPLLQSSDMCFIPQSTDHRVYIPFRNIILSKWGFIVTIFLLMLCWCWYSHLV